jgi:hypothetical protein
MGPCFRRDDVRVPIPQQTRLFDTLRTQQLGEIAVDPHAGSQRHRKLTGRDARTVHVSETTARKWIGSRRSFDRLTSGILL